MAHSHGHHYSHHVGSDRNLLISIILNFGITAIQIVGGIVSNSLSLLSDSLHNLGDAVALLLAYIAGKIGKKESTNTRTFGYKRAEIIAALFNSSVLIAICIFLLVEAYHRFINPEPIKGTIMFIVATGGLVANLISVLILNKDKEHSLNIKAAYLHLLGDTFSSFAVILGGIAIVYYEIWWLDPLITALIGIYIIIHTYNVLKQTIDILMHKVPENISVEEIQKKLEQIPQISNIHHVHVWNLTDAKIHYESHVELNEDLRLSNTCAIRDQIEHILQEEFGIDHVTLQFEFKGCAEMPLIAHA